MHKCEISEISNLKSQIIPLDYPNSVWKPRPVFDGVYLANQLGIEVIGEDEFLNRIR